MELKSSEKLAVKYHAIFDYKLTKKEAIKWQYKNYKVKVSGIKNKKRLQNEKHSKKKLLIAKKAASLLSKIPTVKFVGITGALAMNNAIKNSDIDLMIITSKNQLWTTRMLVYGLLQVTGYELRKPNQNNQKNKLCINMWLDENNLVWDKSDRNIYTAHEIAQIVSLVNKSQTYEKFLFKNKWILGYWPLAVVIKKYRLRFSGAIEIKNSSRESNFLEKLAYKLQYHYMKSKITREVVTPTRALFHPNDWGSVVVKRLSS